MDAAVVGAVDLSCEAVHEAALAALGVDRTSSDAAVALVLERVVDAERLGHQVLALVEPLADASGTTPHPEGAHAAAGLLALADCIDKGAQETLSISAIGKQHASLTVTPKNPTTARRTPSRPIFSGPSSQGRAARPNRQSWNTKQCYR